MDDDLHDDAVGATPDEHTYSVGELADAINGALRDSFDGGVWVRGEIQGWNGKGTHAYFKLAEVVDDRKATISVSFFAPHRNRLKPLLERNGVTLADGLKVRIFGVLDFYAPSGSLGLKMSNIDPRFTLGELALERELLMRRLAESGLLRRNAELELPVAPLRIGLVTSVGSAAYADFTDELARSGLGFQVQVDARLAEMDFGRWDGRRWLDIPAEEIGAWADDLLDHAPGGGETLRALAQRAREFAAAAAAPAGMAATASAVSAVIVVSHGGWINALAHVDPAQAHLPAADWPPPPRHGALVRLRCGNGGEVI